MDAGVVEPAEVLDVHIEALGVVRRAESIDVDARILDDVERRLDEARGRIGEFFALPLTGREGAGFLRYRPGGFYRSHVVRAIVRAWPGAALRRVTVVVFLNSGEFTGGLLRVGGQPIAPEAGMLAAFLAETVPEVTPVRGGVRDTVVDWYYSRSSASTRPELR
jgi:predicted 2-oxoglutarate/Fe(II)-dependent dioxygenase YbiX